VIDYEASFWSLPSSLRESVRVRTWLVDMPDPELQRVGVLCGDCWLVQELIESAPDREFAFRSVRLFSDEDCREALGVNPIVVDIDREEKTHEVLDEQRVRITDYFLAQGWANFQVFSSGNGYHVELDPQSFNGKPYVGWLEYDALARDLRRMFDGTDMPARSHIDPGHDWVRMVGAKNSEGGVKAKFLG
jgi:hypothetical protein